MQKHQIEITQQFGFDAAHYLEGAPSDNNRRLHGHSFFAEVTLKGEADPEKGWVRDFNEVNAALAVIRETLDHQLLNEISGLVDAGVMRTTLSDNLGRIDAVNLRKAHALIESGKTRGKIVLEGF